MAKFAPKLNASLKRKLLGTKASGPLGVRHGSPQAIAAARILVDRALGVGSITKDEHSIITSHLAKLGRVA